MTRPVIHVCSMREATGSTVIAGKTWRWEFHHYLGPTFLRADGEPLVNQPGENHPVWDRFDEWLKDYESDPTSPANSAQPEQEGE